MDQIMSIIAAIDLGYGHTKWAVHAAGTVTQDSFPSLAPAAMAGPSIGGGTARLKVVRVQVGGRDFLVGPDAADAADIRSERLRDTAYCTTEPYQALMMGALAFMRQPVIDVLVLGLPLTTLAAYREQLEAKWTGRHTVPASHTLGTDQGPQTVQVRRVVVIAQPVGALLGTTSEHPSIREEKNLVIDLGYFTLDFLVSNGLRAVEQRSGAVEGGMSGYYDALHVATAKAYHKQYGGVPGAFRMQHHMYEDAILHKGRVLRTSAGPVDLTAPMQEAALKLNEYLDTVAARIQGGDDILNVVLAGGGAELLRDRFKARFPQMSNLLTPKRPQFAICEGLLQVGQNVGGVKS